MTGLMDNATEVAALEAAFAAWAATLNVSREGFVVTRGQPLMTIVRDETLGGLGFTWRLSIDIDFTRKAR